MDLQGASVVVTGGGSGIGAALCRRFAAERPRRLVVADLVGGSAEAVAEEVRSTGDVDEVVAVGCDVADPDAVAELVRTAGGAADVDLFCANAGIATGAGLDASPEQWEAIWRVNVMAHVHAARELFPAWVDRGRGYLLTTASAAGLLTNLGDAPYTATKHAAVGLAEWLSITYGDRGIKVSCLCPQGVRTPMLFPEDTEAVLAAEVVRAHGVIEPEEVAQAVVEGIAAEQFLILPHPEVADYERNRAGDRERWLRGMRRLQANLGG